MSDTPDAEPRATEGGRPGQATAGNARDDRLKAALKANMGRRKAQAKAKARAAQSDNNDKDKNA